MEEIDNKKYPFISIIAPVYNAQNIIAQCIEALLNLDYPQEKREIIIVDNGSQDKTPDIIKKYSGVKLLFEKEKKSSYAARNRGVRCAKGDLVAFIDGDCVADKNWLKNIAVKFEDAWVGCVGGEIINVCSSKKTLAERISEASSYHNQSVVESHPFLPYAQTANAVYRKEVFEQVGLFEMDETSFSGGDADLCWRMQINTSFKLIYCKEAIVFHKDEINFLKFISKFHRYGMGQIALSRKYNFKCELYPFIRKREIYHLLLFLRRFIGSPMKRKGLVYVMMPFFFVIQHIAQECGKRKALRK